MTKPTEGRSPSFWTTLPGVITAIASLVGALAAAGIIHAAVTDSRPSPVVPTRQTVAVNADSGLPKPEMPVNFHVDDGVDGVVLSWSPPSSNSHVVAYDVYRDANPDPIRIQVLQIADLTLIEGVYQWVDVTVGEGETHAYWIASADDQDQRSPLLGPDSITFVYPSGPGG